MDNSKSDTSQEAGLSTGNLEPKISRDISSEPAHKHVEGSVEPKSSDSGSPSPDTDSSTAPVQENATELPQPATRGLRFWLAFIPMCFGTLLAAFESTVTSTALPSIVQEVGGGDLYTWILNGYLLTRYDSSWG